MAVPFLDLKTQYLQIKDEVKEELEDVLESCYYVLGPKVKAFEKKFAEIAGTDHCVAVSSGTAAVHLIIWLRTWSRAAGSFCPPILLPPLRKA